MTYDRVVMIVDVGVDTTEKRKETKKRKRKFEKRHHFNQSVNQSVFPVSSFLIETENRTNPQINPTDEERMVAVSGDHPIVSNFVSSTFFRSSLADTPHLTCVGKSSPR